MTTFSPADELVLLEIAGLDIRIADDGIHLCITGPENVLALAEPKLRAHRDALFKELQRRATPSRHTAR